MKITSVKKKLRLTNKGHLSIFFIGTGSAFSKTLSQNNILVIKGNDHLLIDCGLKCFQTLYYLGVGCSDIRNIFITHSHADHIGGMEEVMMVGRYMTRRLANLIISKKYEAVLWNESLKGGSAYSEVKNGKNLNFRDFVTIQRPKLIDKEFREMMEVDVGSINIKIVRTKHFPQDAKSWKTSHISHGVIIDDKVLYTSDTRFDSELLDEVTKRFSIETIFHDCQLFTGGIHASIEELSTLPFDLKKKMVLMHFGDNWKDFNKKRIQGGFHSWAKQSCFYLF